MNRRVAAVAVVAAAAGGWLLGSGARVIAVAPGASPESAPAGSVVRLLPGVHPPFEVSHRITVVAEPGATVRGPVTVRANGARLVGLQVRGGKSGISVLADRVAIEGVRVSGSEYHGIEVMGGSAVVTDCVVTGLTSEFGQGIEIRNANGRPRSVVRGCRVSSGQEGLVSHVSRVEFRDNVVTGTSLRAIAVTEMSEGLVEGNVVRDVTGSALFCGDMSRCEIRRNVVDGVAVDPAGVLSRVGYPVVVHYHSVARVQDNELSGSSPEPVGLFIQSILTEKFPMHIWPPGWSGAVPGLAVAAMSVGGLGVVAAASAPLVRRRRARRRGTVAGEVASRPGLPEGALAVILGGFAIQSFHMLEHLIQVAQSMVWKTPERGGLLGSAVDTEWVHFAYNSAALVFLVWAATKLWRSVGDGTAAVLAATVAVQCYHMVEHAAKMVQHLAFGADPAPGLLGGRVGLVWFHFGINLAVYAGLAVALAGAVLRTLRDRGVLGRPGLSLAAASTATHV